MKFLEWFIQDDVQKRWAELGGYTAHAKTFCNRKSSAMQHLTTKAFYQTMFKVKDFWAVPEYAELLTAANQRLYPFMVGGEGSAKETLDALANDWDSRLSRSTVAK